LTRETECVTTFCCLNANRGRLAQLVEHLVYTERAGGSSPSPPTNKINRLLDKPAPGLAAKNKIVTTVSPRAKAGGMRRKPAQTSEERPEKARLRSEHWRRALGFHSGKPPEGLATGHRAAGVAGLLLAGGEAVLRRGIYHNLHHWDMASISSMDRGQPNRRIFIPEKRARRGFRELPHQCREVTESGHDCRRSKRGLGRRSRTWSLVCRKGHHEAVGHTTSLLQPYQEPASCARLKDRRRDDSSRRGYIKPDGARIC
jgi:hypothetical protein